METKLRTNLLNLIWPQQNDRHKRMHRTLKEQTASPPARILADRQRVFDALCQHYNHGHSLAALGQHPQAGLWVPSGRSMPDTLREPQYGIELIVQQVRNNGLIKWRGAQVCVSAALVGQLIDLADFGDGKTWVRFCHHDIGINDQSKNRFRRFAPPRQRLRKAQETENKLSLFGFLFGCLPLLAGVEDVKRHAQASPAAHIHQAATIVWVISRIQHLLVRILHTQIANAFFVQCCALFQHFGDPVFVILKFGEQDVFGQEKGRLVVFPFGFRQPAGKPGTIIGFTEKPQQLPIGFRWGAGHTDRSLQPLPLQSRIACEAKDFGRLCTGYGVFAV
ncbi:MAG: hypothetical protein MUF14_05200, partial [Hyphomonadaceae bacterium]|nr:hypothetical protein [Hyphomonadaceae bacterium]